MKFAIAFANLGPFSSGAGAITFGQAAEAAGFESVWTVEHVVVPAGYASTYPYDPSGKMPGGEQFPIPDPLMWLTWVGAATSTLGLATGILILPERNPVVLAKELATIDDLSGGRMHLGVGVGWLEEEFRALGVPWERRGARTDDYIGAMRALWADDKASYDGEFVSFTDCISLPRPPRGRIPVTIGGHSEAAARRAGRIGDGFFPGKGSHEELAHLIGIVRKEAEQAGRDPDAIEVTAGGNGAVGSGALAEVEALAALGVHRVVVPSFLFWGDPAGSLAAYGEQVIAPAGG